jgi:hypothetical protein
MDQSVVGNDINIIADAFDADGSATISKVEFFAANNRLGEVTEAPYVFSWNNVAPGNYSLTAIVWDSTGASATSSPVNIVVGSPASPIMVSEFRFRGSSDLDEFVELYNNTDAPITVAATDGSAGWSLVGSDGMTRFVVPNGTPIPARGHFLAANGSGYSLGSYGGSGNAAADLSYSSGIADGAGVALFSTSDPLNFTFAYRLDAVGFNNANNPVPTLYREGAGLSPIGGSNGEYSFTRKLITGIPQETNDNMSDFVFVSTNGGNYGGTQSQLGAPGPENRASGIQNNAQIKTAVIDPGAASTASPNRVRDYAPVTNGPIGTLIIRRKFTNSTGHPITRLRFRVVDITTLNTPNPGGAQADLRPIDSTNVMVTLTSGAQVSVLGTLVEQPPTQGSGGGLNSTMTVALPGGALVNGASVNVQFVLGMQQAGSFRFVVNCEALP